MEIMSQGKDVFFRCSRETQAYQDDRVLGSGRKMVCGYRLTPAKRGCKRCAAGSRKEAKKLCGGTVGSAATVRRGKRSAGTLAPDFSCLYVYMGMG